MTDTLSVSLKEHFETILSLKSQIAEERDRRYAEVNIEREKALKIKEEADRRALELARDIQALRDEKANGLLDLVKSERGTYATNKEIEPIKGYIAAQTGRGIGMNALFGWAMAVIMAVIAVAPYLKR
jgi:hypothetical protein